MKYYLKCIIDNYILSIGSTNIKPLNSEISKEEHDTLLDIFNFKPKAPEGYEYKLKTDLTWELVELPPQPEPDEDEATEIDYKNALLDLGVEFDD